jgi:hypothetical protein
MNAAAGEAAVADPSRRQGLHHPIVHGDTAYLAWRDAGMVILDIKDRAEPRLIAHKNWSPPFGGGTHNCLPLPDRDLLVVLDEAVLDHQEDGEKLIWLFDVREPSNPVSISTFKSPSDLDYKAKPGHRPASHTCIRHKRSPPEGPSALLCDELAFQMTS